MKGMKRQHPGKGRFALADSLSLYFPNVVGEKIATGRESKVSSDGREHVERICNKQEQRGRGGGCR